MAIISCRECTHQVSDQAASCPSCGAPVARTVKPKRRARRVIFTVLLTLMTLWTLGTLVWLLVPSSPSDRLITLAKSSLQRFDRSGTLRTTDQTQPTEQRQITRRTAAADQLQSTNEPHPSKRPDSSAGASPSQQANSAQLATADRSAAALPALDQPTSALRPVYRTTAEQLYQDYNANVVAIQTKIGTSRVRVTGSVAEIDQDVAGRAVVKLWTSKENSAAMTLTDDQRAAAAQLAKDDAVEIECDKIGHSGGLLQGSDCTLAFVDVRPKQVNLALFLANNSGMSRVYVVGPMSEAACLAHSDGISSTLDVTQQGERVVWRNCTAAARERIPPGGCHLDSSPVTIPDIPTAQLWRYDCSSSGLARASARKKAPPSSQMNAATLASITALAPTNRNSESATPPEPSAGNAAARYQSQDSTAARPIPLSAEDSKPVEGTPPQSGTSPANTAAPVAAGIVASSAQTTERAATTSNIRLASAAESDTGTATAAAHAPVEESTVAHAPQGVTPDTANRRGDSRNTTSAGTTSSTDDLARVRAVDAQAADHISTYCSKMIVSTNRETLMGECRRREAEAWTRLVLQNEFPGLDEATRRKCSEPPFPDTYVAKESCARYELHLN